MQNNYPKKEILVTKASGETEVFSDAKLRRSLHSVDTPPAVIKKIVTQVQTELVPNMPTSQIYRHAFSLLRKEERPTAARYSLKRAIMELGPTGHPFEQLIGELLKSEGYAIEVGKTVQGVCVTHEVDVVAQKGSRHIMVECKFHNQQGVKSDVKVSLYIQSRFKDVEKAWKQKATHGEKFHEAWLVTNTKLTSDAIRYAECVGMKAIGWSYPKENSLEIRIDKAGIHPITCLTTLTSSQKQQLIQNDIILCKDLLGKPELLRSLGVSQAKVIEVVSEAEQLCKQM